MEGILRTRLVTALVLVVVFGAGAVTGLAWDRGVQRRDAQAAGQRSTDRGRRVPTYMKVNPTPTPEQRARIDSIMKDRRAGFRKLIEDFHAQWDPRYQAYIQGTRNAIRAVLTPEQAAQWDSLIARRDSLVARRDSLDAESGHRRGDRGSRNNNRQ